jgi:hypothetical protein
LSRATHRGGLPRGMRYCRAGAVSSKYCERREDAGSNAT